MAINKFLENRKHKEEYILMIQNKRRYSLKYAQGVWTSGKSSVGVLVRFKSATLGMTDCLTEVQGPTRRSC